MGMSYASRSNVRPHPGQSSHHRGPIYCPPGKTSQNRSKKKEDTNSDVDMLPAQTSKPPNTTNAAVFRPRLTHAHREDVPMECRPTALDPEEDDTPQLTFDSHSQLNSHIETEHLNAEETPVFCAIPEEKTTKEHTVDQGALTVHADGANVGDPRLANERTSTVNANAANVGDPRLLAHVCEKIPQFTSYMSAVPEASRRLDEYRLN